MAIKVNIECQESLEALTKKWDYMTSPSFHAGCDEIMDLVFLGSRNGDSVKLIRKATAMRSTFAVVFVGRLVETETGSAITGIYRKRISDYIIGIAILLLSYGFCDAMREINIILSFSLFFFVLLLVIILLKVSKQTALKYTAFLERIRNGM